MTTLWRDLPLASTSRGGVAAPEHRAEPLAERGVMDLSEYKLEPLNKDGERILYRGVHASPADALPRVLVVAPAGEYSSPKTLARLEHEYSLAAELGPQWAVRPLALARHQGRAVLMLDDPGGEPLDRLLGKPMEVGAFLRLAVGIAQAI